VNARADEKLTTYRAKRDFKGTPEPAGAPSPTSEESRFVVHEHHATALHWDLRLERDGVLVSWAVPKGIPPDPKTNHLAVHTEDHPIEYLTFHGDIPEGNYGAGQMTVWDTGTYETVKWSDREVMVVFHGKRASGRYVLFKTRGNQWMIHRMDPPADPDRQPFPGLETFAPMEAVPGRMPPAKRLNDFAFEIGWGGRRTFTYVEGGRARVRDLASGKDVIGMLPELRPLGGALGVVEVLLDGELIVPGGDGRPDADRLVSRLEARSDSAARRLSRTHPVAYMICDVLWLEGHSLVDLPYEERRSRLAELPLKGPAWQVPPSHVGEGPALRKAAADQGLPGVVAKRLTSPYRPGPAPKDWVWLAAD
jgi:bifunctional non-homologous end joining protein LigD